MIKTDDYNDNNLDKLKAWIENASLQNQPKYFEVLVDGMKFIHRTNKTEAFDSIDNWIDEKTKVIRVLVYNTENSHRAQIFELRTPYYVSLLEQEKKDKETAKQKTLQGIPTQEEISQQINSQVSILLQKEKEKIEQDAQKKELSELRGIVKEDKAYIKKLEAKIEEHESQKIKLTPDGLIGIGSGIIGNLIESNPKVLDTVSGLAGIFMNNNTKSKSGEDEFKGDVSFKLKKNDGEEVNGTPASEGAASFKKCDNQNEQGQDENEEEQEEPEFDEETQAKLDLFETAEQNLTDEQFQKYFEIAKFLAHKTFLVDTVYDLLKSESDRMKKAA
ncbi:MAG: hypothetical protein A3F72_01685 [Bacteroidetes bacterium RIFCSPLOWO2_12_FULL_35_15]|nr:MAG: hypothetical protein A3F72_01685 [Bacteroidetes bacterium RIFCSPLOWO2_12_FULL_35_15]